MERKKTQVERRNERFVDKVATKIWYEQPSSDNPYIAARTFCHGYDLTELMGSCSYWEFVFLLFTGERCTADQRELLEKLGISLANPGPRHPATRAAMTAAVSKADASHILPIGLNVLGGAHLGGAEVAACMRYLRRQLKKNPEQTAAACMADMTASDAGDLRPAPGFGTRFGGFDLQAEAMAEVLGKLKGAGGALQWSAEFAATLRKGAAGSWLVPGVAAAVLLDLGFHPKWGSGLFQLLSAPGLLAHGMELTGKPLTAMPFIGDDRYFIDD